MQGAGCKVQGSGSRVQGSGFRMQGYLGLEDRHRVVEVHLGPVVLLSGSGFRISGFRV